MVRQSRWRWFLVMVFLRAAAPAHGETPKPLSEEFEAPARGQPDCAPDLAMAAAPLFRVTPGTPAALPLRNESCRASRCPSLHALAPGEIVLAGPETHGMRCVAAGRNGALIGGKAL